MKQSSRLEKWHVSIWAEFTRGRVCQGRVCQGPRCPGIPQTRCVSLLESFRCHPFFLLIGSDYKPITFGGKFSLTPLAPGIFRMLLLSSADFFEKNISGIIFECQTDWI